MMNSLFISVTGMSAFTNLINISSNNIANMETAGFKASTASFSEILADSITRVAGGDNSGSGVEVQSVSESWTQGSISQADSSTSLAINGWGMFVVEDPGTGLQYFTRDGSFSFDNDGNLVYQDSLLVQGYALDENGNPGPLTDISVSYANHPPQATTSISTTVNLDADAESGDAFQAVVNVYDSLGTEIPLTITCTRSGVDGEWDWAAEIPAEYGSVSSGGAGTLTFDSTGALTSGTDPAIELTLSTGASTQTISWDLYDDAGDTNGGMTQYASDSLLSDSSQDGYASGELVSVDIDDSGRVVCTYTTGISTTPFQVAMADFTNYNGLKKTDGNLYIATLDSGQAVFGRAGEGKMGMIEGGSVELSNVDLSTEMARLITSQTAYQACSRAFSVTNEIFQVLVNMK
ncbi:MAG: flagellar hook protein FlgE [Proteobacteria bacterium]|nr:flagellar hook protein FlgE [Pseudomonadota bacterium]